MERALSALVLVYAAEAKVGDLEVALRVEEHVLRLDVAVRNALGMDVGLSGERATYEAGDELCKVEVREVLVDADVRRW